MMMYTLKLQDFGSESKSWDFPFLKGVQLNPFWLKWLNTKSEF